MKGNHGLEALAALCGGQSDAAPDEARAASRAKSGDSQQSQESARQNPNQQSPQQNMTQQQWQKIVASFSALQNGGMNPSLVAQSFLLGGLPAQTQISDNSFTTMQKLAFHQYLSNLTTQQATQALANAGNSGFGDPSHQALIMALAGGKANPFTAIPGKYSLLLVGFSSIIFWFPLGLPHRPKAHPLQASSSPSSTIFFMHVEVCAIFLINYSSYDVECHILRNEMENYDWLLGVWSLKYFVRPAALLSIWSHLLLSFTYFRSLPLNIDDTT